MTGRAHSAGLLLYRQTGAGLEVLLVHMGGPFWVNRDAGAWSVPKGEVAPDEDLLAAARREFAEELGSPAPDGELTELGQIRQRNGKVVTAWALDADFDADTVSSNTFEMEWPPRSGVRRSFPEVDRAAWFDVATARAKLVTGQSGLLDRLQEVVSIEGR
ncbi:NUDIX domain-containing protein [uncultured Jatrophihabitans sp.]|uniref:NUDIX domain-containing protein n=1 Tax=uncultured Jatrophihabitans sp. TaxID=1610747 RepID=UPI0035CB327D